jgi:N-acetylglucosamine-6-sulfatase
MLGLCRRPHLIALWLVCVLGLGGTRSVYAAVTLPTVSIVASDAWASEAGQNGAFLISRTGPTTARLLVSIRISGTATRGIDYALTGGSVGISNLVAVIPAGAASVTVTLHPKQDTAIEGNETAVITLAAGVGYIVGAPNRALVTILDDDVPTNVSKPNVVVIMTDDQTSADLQVMTKTQTLLAARGVTFTNSFVDYSLCCPSRATFMTGQAAHNHGVLGNNPVQHGGYATFKTFPPGEGNALPVWLKNGGYKTFAFTKLMNGYGGTVDAPLLEKQHIPPGWDVWNGKVDYTAYHYFDYDLNENGAIVHHGCADADYETDLMAGKAAKFISENMRSPQPFFMWLAPLAPHDSFDAACGYRDSPRPASRHLHLFDNAAVARSLNFNETDVSDKPDYIQLTPLLSTGTSNLLRDQVRRRRETLLAVDEMVEKVVNTLFQTGKLNNTLIIFTSDNGFLMGEHRLKHIKTVPYEESIRVPLIIRGPGIPAGAVRAQMVNNVDVVATIVEAANITAGRTLDGHSLLPLMKNALTPWRSALLVQGIVPPYGPTANRFQAVRTATAKYVEIMAGTPDEERELYDLVADPRELENKADNPDVTSADAMLQEQLRMTLATLRTCVGATCWVP